MSETGVRTSKDQVQNLVCGRAVAEYLRVVQKRQNAGGLECVHFYKGTRVAVENQQVDLERSQTA